MRSSVSIPLKKNVLCNIGISLSHFHNCSLKQFGLKCFLSSPSETVAAAPQWIC
uniref:Uncharacterized protein n=1 Tax=Anguilla anguilla TaxID=7936 RepID=A0A0E9R0S8_ANGAN